MSAQTSASRAPDRWRSAAALDALGVIVFVVIGRASHDHGETVPGIASTLWPFATGALVGWLGVARRSPASVGGGVVVCVATVAMGMVLRVVSGQGTAPAFVGVATGFLGAVMVGGRLLLHAWDRRVTRAS